MDFILPKNCIECAKPIENQGYVLCLECEKPCQIYNNSPEMKPDQMREGEMSGFDAKSMCCKADIRLIDMKSTCSDECHEKVIAKMIQQMGEFMYDKDPEGILRKIPMRDIFEKGGLTHEELRSYPEATITGMA